MPTIFWVEDCLGKYTLLAYEPSTAQIRAICLIKYHFRSRLMKCTGDFV